MRIAHLALVVRDYDEAIAWFADKLGFAVIEHTPLGDGKRWVVMAPNDGGTGFLLAKAATPEQSERIGDQTGGRVFLFLNTDNFARDYETMKARGVTFVREPKRESYGTVAVFQDIYGNLWDLIEPTR